MSSWRVEVSHTLDVRHPYVLARSFHDVGKLSAFFDVIHQDPVVSRLYADDGRLPFASINFVTGRDGFTLRDLRT